VPHHQCSKADLIADQPVASSGLPVAALLHMLCHAVRCCAPAGNLLLGGRLCRTAASGQHRG
jgi:hypothetical protein